ncbi:hypothetical protein G6F21_014588 [Rhizopus arrhizus]|nr:hypothetical protein G6F21_014588 [Rhizopus arrhizus]
MAACISPMPATTTASAAACPMAVSKPWPGRVKGASMARRCRPASTPHPALPPMRRATCMWPPPAPMRSAALAWTAR